MRQVIEDKKAENITVKEIKEGKLTMQQISEIVMLLGLDVKEARKIFFPHIPLNQAPTMKTYENLAKQGEDKR